MRTFLEFAGLLAFLGLVGWGLLSLFSSIWSLIFDDNELEIEE